MNQRKIFARPARRAKSKAGLAPLVFLLLLSCNQDSIFYDISNEPPLKDALIDGTPSKMAVVGDRLYVGTINNNKIFYYSKTGWNSIIFPNGGFLIDLAAGVSNNPTSGTHVLYALVFTGRDDLNTALYKYENDKWDIIYESSSAEEYALQTIYGADGKIFAGGMKRGDKNVSYAVFCHDPDTPEFKLVNDEPNLTLLCGAAKCTGGTYLATTSAIFSFSGNIMTEVYRSDETSFKGIIGTGDVIVAVSGAGRTANTGSIHVLEGGEFKPYQQQDVNFTGAMGVWHDYINGKWSPSLLLLGIQSPLSSVNNGYREIRLQTDGKPAPDPKAVKPGPGDNPSTITDEKLRAKYEAGLEKYPVIDILQVPLTVIDYPEPANGWRPPIFASTSKRGLWSWYEQNGEWNTETN